MAFLTVTYINDGLGWRFERPLVVRANGISKVCPELQQRPLNVQSAQLYGLQGRHMW